MSYLLDTNVISELRKGRRADAGVVGWLEQVGADEIFLSVLTLGEIRKGIERVRPQDPTKAQSLECWLAEVEAVHGEQILPVGIAVAQTWGRLSAKDTLPVIDSLIAATALVHGLTVVSRNTRDIERTGVPVLNPFSGPGSSG